MILNAVPTLPVPIAHDHAASRLSCSAVSRTAQNTSAWGSWRGRGSLENVGVVAGMAVPPPLGLADRVEVFLAVWRMVSSSR